MAIRTNKNARIQEETPVRRGRGRPPKNAPTARRTREVEDVEYDESPRQRKAQRVQEETPVRRGRGRPPKNAPTARRTREVEVADDEIAVEQHVFLKVQSSVRADTSKKPTTVALFGEGGVVIPRQEVTAIVGQTIYFNTVQPLGKILSIQTLNDRLVYKTEESGNVIVMDPDQFFITSGVTASDKESEEDVAQSHRKSARRQDPEDDPEDDTQEYEEEEEGSEEYDPEYEEGDSEDDTQEYEDGENEEGPEEDDDDGFLEF